MSLNVQLLRDSFTKAKPIAGQVADKFYEFLWGDFPASKALFEDVEMASQKKALMGSLSFVVDHLEEPDKLIPFLKNMGQRHVKYGTQDEHYGWVGQSLLKTFAHFFGEEWTAELEEEWTNAYMFVAQTMQEGASEYAPELGDIRFKAKEVCNSLLQEILSEGIDEQFEEYVRAKVRKVLFRVLEEESEALFKKAA